MVDTPLTLLAESELTDFKTFIERYCATWTTPDGQPDFNEASQFYAKDDDVVFYDVVPPVEGYRGWENLKAGLAQNVYAKLSSLEWTPYDLWVTRRDSLAWGGFKWKISTRTNDGKTQEIEGRMTIIWEKRDGKWLIVH